LKKHEWIEVLSMFQEKDWMDWTNFVVSVLSPILMLISVVIAWKATKASQKATELNLRMYQDQKDELEKSFLPVFEINMVNRNIDNVFFDLVNKSNNPISITNIETDESIYSFEQIKENANVIKFKLLSNGNFDEGSHFKMRLDYETLNHKFYSSELTLKFMDRTLVIQEHKLSKIN